MTNSANVCQGVGGGSVYSEIGGGVGAAEYDKLGGRYIRVNDGGRGAVNSDADMIDYTFLDLSIATILSFAEKICMGVISALLACTFAVCADGYYARFAPYLCMDKDTVVFKVASTVAGLQQRIWVHSSGGIRMDMIWTSLLMYVGLAAAYETFPHHVPKQKHWLLRLTMVLLAWALDSLSDQYLFVRVLRAIYAFVLVTNLSTRMRALGYRSFGKIGWHFAGLYQLFIVFMPGHVIMDWVAYESFESVMDDFKNRIDCNSQAPSRLSLTDLQARWQRALQLPMSKVPGDVLLRVVTAIEQGAESAKHPSRQWALYGDKLIGMIIAREAVLNGWSVGAATRVQQAISSNTALASVLSKQAGDYLSADQKLMSDGKLATIIEAIFGLSYHYSAEENGKASFDAFVFRLVPEVRDFTLNRGDGTMVG